MGIIQKQSITGTVYSYVGVILGFITSALLFPRMLSTEQVGLLRILVSYSVILAQFAVLGMNAVTVKFFPYFRDQAKKHHGYIGLVLMVSLAGAVISLAAYLSLHDYLTTSAGEKSRLFVSYFYYVIPLFIFTLLFNVFDTYLRVLYNAVKGIVYKEIVQRVLIIVSVLMFFLGIVDFHTFVLLYVTAFMIPALLLMATLIAGNNFNVLPDWDFIDKTKLRAISGIAFFGLLSSYSGVLIMNIDSVMIDHYLGLSQTGIYTITFFFGTLIIIPARTMNKISSVVIADSWKKNDTSNILSIYKKSSLLLAIAGAFAFIGIWVNIENVFKIIGPDYEQGKYVIFFIGLANVVEAFAGPSSLIIANSSKYKWLSFFLLVYTVLIIVTNIIFIPVWGIVGAALASFLSRFIFVLIRFFFLKHWFDLQPYSYRHMLILAISVIALFLTSLIPQNENFWIDTLIRSAFVSAVFVPLIYVSGISDDFNKTVRTILRFGKDN